MKQFIILADLEYSKRKATSIVSNVSVESWSALDRKTKNKHAEAANRRLQKWIRKDQSNSMERYRQH